MITTSEVFTNHFVSALPSVRFLLKWGTYPPFLASIASIVYVICMPSIVSMVMIE